MANKYWTERNMFDLPNGLCFNKEYGIFYLHHKEITIFDGDKIYKTSDVFYRNSVGTLSPFGSLNEDIINAFDYTYIVKERMLQGKIIEKPIVLEKINIKFFYTTQTRFDNNGQRSPIEEINAIVSKNNIQELTKKLYVCSNYNYNLWYKEAKPIYFNKKIGDEVYCIGKGTCKVIELYDQPDKYVLRLDYNGEEFDVEFGDNNVLDLPTFDGYNEYAIFNEAKKEQLLQPYAILQPQTQQGIAIGGRTLNVYWQLINEAASYTISIYKKISRPHKAEIMKMKDFTVERNIGYLAVDNLVGTDFIIKVAAEDRNGNIIAMSRGIENSGEPKNW